MLLTTTNNNTAQGILWNHYTTSDNPLGIHLVVVDGNQAQSGNPHEMNQSKRAPNGNNLALSSTPSGINLSNSLLILGNPLSTKQPETAKKKHNQTTTSYSHKKELS